MQKDPLTSFHSLVPLSSIKGMPRRAFEIAWTNIPVRKDYWTTSSSAQKPSSAPEHFRKTRSNSLDFGKRCDG